MSDITHRPGDIRGKMILVAQVNEVEAILGVLREHESAVLTLQKWVNDIQSFDLRDHFGSEEGSWETLERHGYYAQKEDYDDIDNMVVEPWTDTARQAERIAGLTTLLAELNAKALELTAPERRAIAAMLRDPYPLFDFDSQH
jgi:hypothetical protein